MNNATDKQVKLLRSLLSSKEQGEKLEAIRDRANSLYRQQRLTKAAASDLIGALFGMPDEVKRGSLAPQVEPGYYKFGDNYIVVTRSPRTGRCSAKILNTEDGVKWEYQRGLVYQLEGLRPMTLEEAKAIGHAHGVCVKCCRPLSNPASVEAGIGPVCAGSFA